MNREKQNRLESHGWKVGSAEEFLGLSPDESELLNTNESEQEESVFRDKLSEMSHEMRTPLTSIMGFAELLLEDESITGTSREYLQIISAEAKRMSEMLNGYISILRSEMDDDNFEK